MQAANLIELPIRTPRKATRPTGAFLTPEEVLAVLRVARDRDVRTWAMILLAYRHGLRASEVCGLRLADVDLKDGAITIARLKGSMRTVQPLYAHRGQPLLDEVAALRSWLKVRPTDGSDYLFTSQKGGRLDRTQFFRIFQVVAEAAGLPAEKRHPHCLKHSLASHLVAGNVNLALVKQALGHRSISSTMVYVGTTDGQAAEAVQAALMGGHATKYVFCCVSLLRRTDFVGLRLSASESVASRNVAFSTIRAMDIRIRASQRAGELIAEGKKAGIVEKQGGDRKSSSSSARLISTQKLEELGISYDQSSQWQKLAGIPAEEFEEELPVRTGKRTSVKKIVEADNAICQP